MEEPKATINNDDERVLAAALEGAEEDLDNLDNIDTVLSVEARCRVCNWFGDVFHSCDRRDCQNHYYCEKCHRGERIHCADASVDPSQVIEGAPAPFVHSSFLTDTQKLGVLFRGYAKHLGFVESGVDTDSKAAWENGDSPLLEGEVDEGRYIDPTLYCYFCKRGVPVAFASFQGEHWHRHACAGCLRANQLKLRPMAGMNEDIRKALRSAVSTSEELMEKIDRSGPDLVVETSTAKIRRQNILSMIKQKNAENLAKFGAALECKRVKVHRQCLDYVNAARERLATAEAKNKAAVRKMQEMLVKAEEDQQDAAASRQLTAPLANVDDITATIGKERQEHLERMASLRLLKQNIATASAHVESSVRSGQRLLGSLRQASPLWGNTHFPKDALSTPIGLGSIIAHSPGTGADTMFSAKASLPRPRPRPRPQPGMATVDATVLEEEPSQAQVERHRCIPLPFVKRSVPHMDGVRITIGKGPSSDAVVQQQQQIKGGSKSADDKGRKQTGGSAIKDGAACDGALFYDFEPAVHVVPFLWTEAVGKLTVVSFDSRPPAKSWHATHFRDDMPSNIGAHMHPKVDTSTSTIAPVRASLQSSSSSTQASAGERLGSKTLPPVSASTPMTGHHVPPSSHRVFISQMPRTIRISSSRLISADEVPVPAEPAPLRGSTGEEEPKEKDESISVRLASNSRSNTNSSRYLIEDSDEEDEASDEGDEEDEDEDSVEDDENEVSEDSSDERTDASRQQVRNQSMAANVRRQARETAQTAQKPRRSGKTQMPAASDAGQNSTSRSSSSSSTATRATSHQRRTIISQDLPPTSRSSSLPRKRPKRS